MLHFIIYLSAKFCSGAQNPNISPLQPEAKQNKTRGYTSTATIPPSFLSMSLTVPSCGGQVRSRVQMQKTQLRPVFTLLLLNREVGWFALLWFATFQSDSEQTDMCSRSQVPWFLGQPFEGAMHLPQFCSSLRSPQSSYPSQTRL